MSVKLSPGRLSVAAWCAAGAALAAGCAERHPSIEPRPGPVENLPVAQADSQAEAVRRDPIAYLRQVAAKCRALQSYTLRFTRYERRGLLQQMYGPEHILCTYRRQPLSIHMKWLDEDLKYYESVYVAGQEDNKVRFVTRWWVPPLAPPPGVNKVDLQTPVTWGESKRPLTDFGLESLMERTLQSLDEAKGDVVVTYEGLLKLPETGAIVHHLRLAYPESLKRVPVQELYIDVATDLPAGTVLKYSSGRIDAAYFYEDLNTAARISDDDFLLDAEKQARQDAAGGVKK